jgi:hypothetical protein
MIKISLLQTFKVLHVRVHQNFTAKILPVGELSETDICAL